jgi:hypothetical protein
MFLMQIKIFMQTIMSTDCKRSAGLLRLKWSGSLGESLSRAFSAVIKNYDHPWRVRFPFIANKLVFLAAAQA